VVTATNGESIVGLSGRTLKLSSFMKANNIGSDYRLGLKNLMDVYPSRVRDKITADAKLKRWDEPNKKAQSEVNRDVAEFEAKNSSKFKFHCEEHNNHMFTLRLQMPTTSRSRTSW